GLGLMLARRPYPEVWELVSLRADRSTKMELKELRASIPATREVAYFNTGWAGPSPEPVVERMKEVFDRECAVGPASLEAQRLAREVNESARVAVAGLFAAPPEEVMITHGTTEGLH